MQTPIQLTFRGMAHSKALAAHAARRTDKLERLFTKIVSCHVVFELVGHRHRHGDRYRISIHLGVPGRELLAGHRPSSSDDSADNPYVDTDRAFDEAERQLEDWVKRRRTVRHGEVRWPN
jgi:ribosomal subunit interface protein